MNIGLDATAMFGPLSKNRGIGNYSVSLFSTLISADKENEYFLLNCVDDSSFLPYLGDGTENFHEEILFCGKNAEFLKNGCEEIYGDIIRTFIERNNIDIFIITSPFDLKFIPYKREWFGNTLVCSIVYDIIPYVMKKQYLKSKEEYDVYMNFVESIRFCDRYLVISESVRDDMVSCLGFDRDKIDVIYGAYDRHFRQVGISENEKAELFGRFGVKDGFIMCTGGDDYRKNIPGLIEAYSKLPEKLISAHQLVIVCKLSPDTQSKYREQIERLKLSGRVIMTNFVSNDELVRFYNLAYLMAFPSRYEGFGLPVVEAWACGTPVLTSNNSSLGEVAGEGAVLVDPFDTADITRGLEYALTDAELDKMLEVGQKRLKEIFNWDNVASITHDALIKAAETAMGKNSAGGTGGTGGTASTDSAKSAADSLGDARKRLAVFTPLPPLQSGISDYSEDIIRALSEWFDIDVFIDTGYTADCKFPSNVSVYPHTKYPGMNGKYFDTMYQMGNSEFHVYMYDYIERFGGTLVLHDYNMNGVVCMLQSTGKQKLYERFVKADYSGEEAAGILSHGLTQHTPLNGLVVNPAHRVIVHDIHLKKALIGRNIGKKVFVIPHYAKPEAAPEDTESIRTRFGYSKDDIIFAAFGIIAESKRIIPLLKAFSRVHDTEKNAKLLLCGKPVKAFERELERFIAQNGLKEYVNVTGFVNIDDFVSYIDICDVCFNLRYPYNGESSGSLARILAKGKPVVVNRIGSFDSVPDEACIKLPSVEFMNEDGEVDEIYRVMNGYVNSPEEYLNTAANGREYAEKELDLHVVAGKYRDALISPVRRAFTRETANRVLRLVKEGMYSTSDRRALAHMIAYSKNEVDA